MPISAVQFGSVGVASNRKSIHIYSSYHDKHLATRLGATPSNVFVCAPGGLGQIHQDEPLALAVTKLIDRHVRSKDKILTALRALFREIKPDASRPGIRSSFSELDRQKILRMLNRKKITLDTSDPNHYRLDVIS